MLRAACGPEPAFAPVGVGEFLRFLKSRLQERRDDQLGDAVAGLYRLWLAGVVVQRHHDFPAVIRVDHAYLVGGGQAALGGHAAAGVDEPGVPFRDLNGKPRVEEVGLARRHGDIALVGLEVRPGGVCRAVARQPGGIRQFFDADLHFTNS